MGMYVNPKNTSKEQWLETFGFRFATFTEAKQNCIDDHMIVCLIDNGGYTAAAILYDTREETEFTQLDDPRPRIFYVVGVQDLLSLDPQLARYVEKIARYIEERG